MKFTGLLNEAFVDNLPIHKVDKHILKKMYEVDIESKASGDIGDFLQKMAKDFAIDLDRVVKMYMTYRKYKDILFSEEGIMVVEEYDTLSPELYDITKETILNYLYKNYNGKTIFSYEGIEGEVVFNEDVDIMMEEDMWPETYISMPVTGSYTYTYTPYRQEPREETTDDVGFHGTIYLSPLPYVRNGEVKPVGFDFLNFAQETFGDWMTKVKGRKYSDQIDSGKIKPSFFPPPKNLSDGEIKRVCDQWVEICKRIIKRNSGLLLEYKDYVEHEGGVFEGYNRKRKTIK
jgi:hypothetical protein